jgi:alanyl-tRNA synthetase
MPAVRKADLRERVAAKRKAWDGEVKAREAAATKAVSLAPKSLDAQLILLKAAEAVARYFQEQPNAMGYFAQVDVGSNVKAMQSILNQGKTLGKAVYILSVDEHAGKVTHGNYLPPGLSAQGFDARSWASSVADVVGGKVRFLLCKCGLPDWLPGWW